MFESFSCIKPQFSTKQSKRRYFIRYYTNISKSSPSHQMDCIIEFSPSHPYVLDTPPSVFCVITLRPDSIYQNTLISFVTSNLHLFVCISCKYITRYTFIAVLCCYSSILFSIYAVDQFFYVNSLRLLCDKIKS